MAKPARQITAPFIYTIVDLEDFSHEPPTLWPEQAQEVSEVDLDAVLRRVKKSIIVGKMKSENIKNMIGILDHLETYFPGGDW